MPSLPPLNIIVATDLKMGIGRGGSLPWPPIKSEMAYFARVTKRPPPSSSSSSSSSPTKTINAVIMGRKTWESIPTKFRPLKGRINVVISRQDLEEVDGVEQHNYDVRQREAQNIEGEENVIVAQSLEEGAAILTLRYGGVATTTDISSAPKKLLGRVFVIGGAEIYKAALQAQLRHGMEKPWVERILWTKVHREYECDTHFPWNLDRVIKSDMSGWRRSDQNEAKEWTGEEEDFNEVKEEAGVGYEITSAELHSAFQTLLSTPTQRGLLASIAQESIIPGQTLPASQSDFFTELSALQDLLQDDEPAYIILRRHSDRHDGYAAVTYVPDTANVRKKMLFASTRLSLLRELGSEKFGGGTWFITTKEEVGPEGWRKLEGHERLKAPLTEEEQALEGVRQAEVESSRGTSTRSSHVSNGLAFPMTEQAIMAIRNLGVGTDDNLVQLAIDIPKETIELAETSSIAPEQLMHAISDKQPRFSFYRYEHEHRGQQQSPIVFIYTCPTEAKIKERMLYASSRANVISTATGAANLTIAKKLEASNPSEITAEMLEEEFHPKEEQKAAFARPKRPGRR
ncbi:MAG: hypothetical protein M1823_001673 [Watsoniomyces obsoletus]|nr:MAG: hypothetical protein M1823_001673 [Watsoniomyces obsoletus]